MAVEFKPLKCSNYSLRTCPDHPRVITGKRNGNGAGPQLCDTLDRVCRDAEALVGREQAQRRVAVTQEALDEKMDNLRGAVTMGKKASHHWTYNTNIIVRTIDS